MAVVSGTQYAQLADLAMLGLNASVLSQIPTATQSATLLAASSVADSYLQSRYDLPILTWGQDLVRAVCHIAVNDLLATRGGIASGDSNIVANKDAAIAWLDEVGKGTQTPAYLVDSSAPGSSSDGSEVTTSPGGLQMVTSDVRGWTRRGNTTSFSDNEFWGGTGSL